MTPKEKARELVDKYYHLFSVKLENTISIYEAKHCALIAVDEVIKTYTNKDGTYFLFEEEVDYWQNVKQEIEKL